jgi:hypothetical protein
MGMSVASTKLRLMVAAGEIRTSAAGEIRVSGQKPYSNPDLYFANLLRTNGKPGNPENPGVFGDESGSERETVG